MVLSPAPAERRLGVQVVAIDPSAAFRKALWMWLLRTAVSVDPFHMVKLSNDMLTEVRQRLTQQAHSWRGRSSNSAWGNRRLLLLTGDTHSYRARDRLRTDFATDDPTFETAGRLAGEGTPPDAPGHRRSRGRNRRERTPTGPGRTDRATGREPALAHRQPVVERGQIPPRPGATTAKVKANNTAIKHIKRTGRGFTTNREEPKAAPGVHKLSQIGKIHRCRATSTSALQLRELFHHQRQKISNPERVV